MYAIDHQFCFTGPKRVPVSGERWGTGCEPMTAGQRNAIRSESVLADHGGPKLKYVGHRLMLRNAPAVNYEMEAWFRT